MRDLAVTLAVFGSLPFIVRRPWIGILVWSWLGFMNPHRMAWGFSTTMPFAAIVAVVTMSALLFSRDEKKIIPWERESVVLLLFTIWMFVTTLFAIYPELAWDEFNKVIKIQLMIFVAMMLITTPERLKWLVWTIALSLAFYGVKGGIFTIVHGGVYHVQGPPDTFIGGNNEIGLALAMTVPLLYFLARDTSSKGLRSLVYVMMVLTALAAFGTQSRGALLGMAVMGAVFWLKSRQKFMVALLAGAAVLAIALVMPPEWYERMNTIKTYDRDESAMGRINAWRMAVNIANHRFFGGGFETFQEGMFALYAPDPSNVHDVHSIYFEALGEQGYVGLLLFLLLAFFTWRSAAAVRKAVKSIPEHAWMGELAGAVQVSLIAYLSAGTFLGMAYFDYYYNLILIMVLAKAILRQQGLLGEPQRRAVAGGLAKPGAPPAARSAAARVPVAPIPRS